MSLTGGGTFEGSKFENLLCGTTSRVPRYRMLLEDCLKKTDSGHDDYPKLQAALKLIKKTCVHINEIYHRRQDADQLVYIDEVITQKPKGFTCVTQGRRFLRRDNMMKVPPAARAHTHTH